MKKRQHSIVFDQPTLTQQHSKDEVDINNIMKRYQKTGVIDHVAKYQGEYGENTSQDYHEGMTVIAKANNMFADLPSAARKQFNNDPAAFLDFVQNEENFDKLHEMGLTNQPKSPPSDDPAPHSPPVQPGKTQSETASAASTPSE